MASVHLRPRSVVVWDPVVRLFHWLVVIGFMANMFVAEEGKLVHRWIGYGILALIAVRLVWGIFGTAYARFSNFVPTPSALWGYVKALSVGREPRYIGHNPAAAIMMITLVLLLVFCGITGWMQGLDAFWGNEWVQDVHKISAYAILALAGLHVHGRGCRELETSGKSHLVYNNGTQARSRWLRHRSCGCFS